MYYQGLNFRSGWQDSHSKISNPAQKYIVSGWLPQKKKITIFQRVLLCKINDNQVLWPTNKFCNFSYDWLTNFMIFFFFSCNWSINFVISPPPPNDKLINFAIFFSVTDRQISHFFFFYRNQSANSLIISWLIGGNSGFLLVTDWQISWFSLPWQTDKFSQFFLWPIVEFHGFF